jgi:hypothetical protein
MDVYESAGVGFGTVAGVFSGEEAFEFELEFVDVLEVAIDGGEADVGDGVDVFEAVHDEFADGGGGAFALWGVDDEGFDGVYDLLHLGDGDFAFLAGVKESGEDFLAVEVFAAAVFLYDHVGNFVETFVGGEAFVAALTLASTADGVSIFGLAAVDDFVLGEGAEGAFHG